MRDLKAVYFDFGGTLFSYRGFASRNGAMIDSIAERFGVPRAERARIGPAYGEASREVFARFDARSYYLHRDLYTEIFRSFAGHFDLDPGEAELLWAYEVLRRTVLESLELREDCNRVLEALRRRGLCLAIVSNIDDDFLLPMVEKVGLGARLDHWWSSEAARSCKPDPGFFRFAMERTGHRPEEVLFVGDSPDHDIAGAQPLGMRTALISEHGITPPGVRSNASGRPEADHRIAELSELLALLEVPAVGDPHRSVEDSGRGGAGT